MALKYRSIRSSRLNYRCIRFMAPSPILPVEKDEPLRLELESFFDCVETRAAPRVGGRDACRALEVALAIASRIEEHSQVVARTLASLKKV